MADPDVAWAAVHNAEHKKDGAKDPLTGAWKATDGDSSAMTLAIGWSSNPPLFGVGTVIFDPTWGDPDGPELVQRFGWQSRDLGRDRHDR